MFRNPEPFRIISHGVFISPDAMGQPESQRFRFSLRRGLLVVGVFSLLLASLRFSFLYGGHWVAVPITGAVAALAGLCTGKWRGSILIAAGLAVASFLFLQVRWIGGHPRVLLELHVRDELGRPIVGAEWTPGSSGAGRRFHGSTTTDPQGRLTLLSNASHFGGTRWLLFGVIPISEGRPRHRFVLTHPECHDLPLRYWPLVEGYYENRETLPRRIVDETIYSEEAVILGYEMGEEVPVLERAIVMRRK